MSFSEHTRQLEQSFRTTTELQRSLLQNLQRRRGSWSSARPSTLAPSPELELLAQQLARQEALRAELTAAIARVLPPPLGGSAKDLHVNVTLIAGAMAPAAARSLQQAAAAATEVAKAVRTEVTLGQRLLRFTQRAQQSLVGGLGGGTAAPAAPGYDRRARRSRASSSKEGTLVDGRI